METEQYVTYKITESNVAVVTLDNKDARVNIFSTPFMEALEHTVQEIDTRQDVKAVLIRSGKSAFGFKETGSCVFKASPMARLSGHGGYSSRNRV